MVMNDRNTMSKIFMEFTLLKDHASTQFEESKIDISQDNQGKSFSRMSDQLDKEISPIL